MPYSDFMGLGIRSSMSKDWPSQQEDIRCANAVVERHTFDNCGEPLPMVEVVDQGQGLELRVPDWVLEMMSIFSEQYGVDEGSVILGRVLTHYLLDGETLH